ncbi:MAG: pyridoxal-phosphate dependent enzyme [Phycisphaerales bacterium]|nr:pyridoxal-phosphate dependent enzyme [Phycisphaerales bacterium]
MASHDDVLNAFVPLGSWPSPVRELSNIRSDLWIKDDGDIHSSYGGNKVRKLEYLLAGCEKEIVTFGAMGSHHALATAVHGTSLGHQVSVVTHPRHYSVHAEQVLLATMSMASMHPCDSHESAHEQLRVLGEDRTVIPAGGSSPIGSLGFVRAAIELGEQVKRGELPAPRRIYVAAGTAGTLAGLAVGLPMAGLDTTVIGVRVVPEAWLTLADVESLCRQTSDLLHVEPGPWQLDDRWLGEGYSVETDSGREAVKKAGEWNLNLETCYTGKAMAAAMHDSGGPDLFWQTHNQASIESLVPSRACLDAEIWRWDDVSKR